jgi:hypothetical protein
MNKRATLLLLAMTLINHPVSQAWAKSDIAIDGEIEMTGKVENWRHGEIDHDLKIKFKAEDDTGMKGFITLQKSGSANDVRVRDAFVRTGWHADNRWAFGLMKADFGLEYERSSRERSTLSYSPLSHKLADLRYVGQQTSIVYEQRQAAAKKDEGAEFRASIGYAESLDADLRVYYAQPFNARGDRFGVWMMGQGHRINGKREPAGALDLALFSSREVTHQYEVEVMAGVDPDETVLSKTFLNGPTIWFCGLRTLYGLRTAPTLPALVPKIGTSFTVHDSRLTDYNTLSVLVGVDYYATDHLTLAADLEQIGTNSREDRRQRYYDESYWAVGGKYFF